MPARIFRCSIARCGTLPSPGDAKVSSFGLFFASAAKSATERAGIEG
jgi:hypothetical protein